MRAETKRTIAIVLWGFLTGRLLALATTYFS
jgi:hypothetical protein